MEWLILLLLVPAILVPIVLLGGFAGCSFCAPVGSVSPPIVTATPKNVDHITVSWQPTAGQVVGYHFVRTGGTLPPRVQDLGASITTVEDPGLDPGTDYTYEVSVTVNVINCDDEYEPRTSDPGTDTARTFLSPTDQTVAPNNYCFVQRIPAGPLLPGGSQVRLKVWGAPAGNVTINRIYISRPGSGNLWNSAADLTPVRTSPLTLPNDQPQDLAEIAYTLDQTQDLIIAFDFTATAGQANIRFAPEPGVTLYFKPGVQQASLPTRDSDYITQPDPRLYLVATIIGVS